MKLKLLNKLSLVKYQKYIQLSLVITSLASCLNVSNSLSTRSSTAVTTSSVQVGYGLVLKDNPIILSNNTNLSTSYDLNLFVSTAQITTGAFLTGATNCYGLDYCFEVRENSNSSTALQTSNGKWGYVTTSAGFLEVNSYYHINKILKQFFGDLYTSYNLAYNVSVPYYDTSLQLSRELSDTSFKLISSTPLIAYADCDAEDNAYFDRTTNTLCFGYMSDNTYMKWAQDSTVVYHETGHFLQRTLLNHRNFDSSSTALTKTADMGNYHYDEAGSIGEGLSDFFSYYINQRTHFAEWAAGRVLNSSRPMSESDDLHITSLLEESGYRLKYPDYIDYNPNDHTVPSEDIHLSGMIVSHYLVALTKDLVSKCSFSTRDAQTQVIHVLHETLAELGDLNAIGTYGGTAGRINLNATYSYDWLMKVNPINYRSFMQTFAKFLKYNLGNSTLNRCNGTTYTQDQMEALIDDYGLLLFRTYNENRNLSSTTTTGKTNTAVTSSNRNTSILINKTNLIYDPTTGAAQAYIIDKQSTILSGITSLQSSGLISSLSTQTPSDLGFNNNNGKVSPGEVVAIGLNLYNNSNSTMGGVQVLANDWKTLDTTTGKPCIYPSSMANDYTWTTTSEGGTPCTTVTATSSSDFQPICVMQYNGTSSTTWVSQHSFRTKQALDSSYCLNNADDRDCFIRAIKGADQAYYSKLDPKKNWYSTMQSPNTTDTYSLDWGNVILFEVSKHIPAGTVVDCRLRVRFTNCDDCYHNSSSNYYDYTDTDYNGPTPYKVLHLKMTIID
jgi:hypothetical protein